jgi:hypothetical protein
VKKWINIILYQTAWAIAVIGAARGDWWAGPAAVTAFAIVQLWLSERPRADLYLMVVAAAVGFIIDSGFAQSGALRYAASEQWTFAPIWIVALWINFSLTLNHSLAYLKLHLALASLLGAIGAPLAYWAAAKGWNAIAFEGPPTATLAALSVVWAVATPLLCVAARRFTERDGHIPLFGGAVS